MHVRTTHRIGSPAAGLMLILSGVLAWAPTAEAGKYELADLKALQSVFVDLAENVRPGVVAIRTYRLVERGGGRVPVRYSQGSGFVIDAAGYVGTNFHVIDGAEEINVVLHDGSDHRATVTSSDRRRDLAVLKIDRNNLTPVKFGDTSALRPNMWSFACGNPFGRANLDGNTSITYGTISALGRDMTVPLVANSPIEYYGNLIETTAAIHPGNSGGPLFNLEGEVIGVVTAIEVGSGDSQEGSGFAIPTNADTLRILDTLKAGKEVRYGFLGVEIRDAEPPSSRRVAESFRSRGARITNISPADGPAARAGLRIDDIVVAVDGEEVHSSDDLVRMIQFKAVGSNVKLTYMRNRAKQDATVTLADRALLISRE